MTNAIIPELERFRWIIVNSSGGKDSQTALRVVVERCDREGIPRHRIVVSHQCLGQMEWPGTRELAHRQAFHYDLRFVVSNYRDKEGEQLSLLDYVKKRRRWPDNKNRFCTSEFKRGPGGRVITALCKESPGDVLQIFGFRADESTARAKKKVFAQNLRQSNSTRQVWDWLPIHHWNEQQVWNSIKQSGVPSHPAYKLGMPRLSCCFCLFAPKAALMIAGRANPELLDRYVDLEREIGHTFQNGKPIADIKQAIQAGEQAGSMDGRWNM